MRSRRFVGGMEVVRRCDPYASEDDSNPAARAETHRLETGEMPCSYCGGGPCQPGCPGLDVHPVCAWCGNICGHRSASCPGRYE